MEFVLDFDYDEDVVELYHQSINHRHTSEFHDLRQLSLEQVRTRLFEISKSKNKNGFDIHGILKVYLDNKLVAISFPRKILSSEYDKFSLKSTNEYHRLSGIFISEDARGQGLGSRIIEWFIGKYEYILWTAHCDNFGSIKTAQKANLTEIKERDVVDSDGNFLYRTKVFSN